MSIKKEPLIVRSAANSLFRHQKRIASLYDQNITIGAAGAATLLEVCYPIGFNTSTSKHTPWVAPDPTVMVITLTGATGGSFTVTVNGATTAAIAWNAAASVVAAAIKAIGYTVTVSLGSLIYTITFDDTPEIRTLPTVSADTALITGDLTESVTVNDGTAQIADPTILNISTGATVPATGGTFTITYDGNTSGAIAFDATGPEIAVAVLAIGTHAPDSVTVTRDGLGDITVYFDDIADLLSLPTVSGTLTNLTGATAELATAVAGNVLSLASASDVEVDIGTSTGGTFTVTVDGTTTAPIAYNAAVGAVDSALAAIGFVVSTALVSTTYTITFNAKDEVITLPVITADTAGLTGATAGVATAGVATNGAERIRGFINPNDTQTGVNTGSGSAIVLTGTDTLCTITTTDLHGLETGMSLTFSGADEAKLNITATITVLTTTTFTYTVAAVAGGTTETSVAYTTTNDEIATMMIKGTIHYDAIADLISASDITALQAALRADLIPDGLIVQGLSAVH